MRKQYRFFSHPFCRSLSTSTINRSAFFYMEKYKSNFDAEFITLIEVHHEATKKMDAIATEFMSRAHCLKTIRATYTGNELNDALEKLIQNDMKATGDHKNILSDLARKIIKWNARNRMMEIGEEGALAWIHEDNLKKYGNTIGPLLSDLEKKYGGDSEKIAQASKRFRSGI